MSDRKPYAVLKSIEIDTVISFFMYHADTSQRSMLMSEYPHIYNKLVEKQIVKVVLCSDDTVVV